MTFVPALGRCVIPRPRFEANEPSFAGLVLCLRQERRCDALSLVIGMGRQMPDHSPGSGPSRQAVALALQIEQSDDRAVLVRYQLDRILGVSLLLALDGVEEGGVEERQEPADQPAALVFLLVRSDLDGSVLLAGAGLARVVGRGLAPRPLRVPDLAKPRRPLALGPDCHRRGGGLSGAGEADAVPDEDAARHSAVDGRRLVVARLGDSRQAEPAMGEPDGLLSPAAPFVQGVI